MQVSTKLLKIDELQTKKLYSFIVGVTNYIFTQNLLRFEDEPF